MAGEVARERNQSDIAAGSFDPLVTMSMGGIAQGQHARERERAMMIRRSTR
jgi:hypothetical protein